MTAQNAFKNDSPSTRIVGTFDVSNFGDLMYPVVAKRLLSKYGVSVTAASSPLGGVAPESSGYVSQTLRATLSGPPEEDTLLIGGGELIRTDWLAFMVHYPEFYRRGVVGRLFPWKQNDRAARAGQRMMGHAGPGPFILPADQFGRDARVGYFSVGVQSSIEASCVSQVRDSFENAGVVYLRDSDSEEFLRQAGVKRPLIVAPDLLVGIREAFDSRALEDHGRRLLEQYGVPSGRRNLLLQVNNQIHVYTPGLHAECKKLIAQGWNIIAVPFGYCDGLHDDLALVRVLKDVGPGVYWAYERSIFGILSLVSIVDAVAATSMHANIVSFSMGTPHIALPGSWNKVGRFMRQVGLPEKTLCLKKWVDLSASLAAAILRREENLHLRDAAVAHVCQAVQSVATFISDHRANADSGARINNAPSQKSGVC